MVSHLEGMGFQSPSQWEIVSEESQENEEEKKADRQTHKFHSRHTSLGSPTALLGSDILLAIAS